MNLEKKSEHTKKNLENLQENDEKISITDNLNKTSTISITEENNLDLKKKYVVSAGGGSIHSKTVHILDCFKYRIWLATSIEILIEISK